MRQPPRALTRQQCLDILAQPSLRAVTGLRNRCMLELMYRCGLRVSEVVNLTWDCVQDDGVDMMLVLQGTKGSSPRKRKGRNVPVPSASVELLREWRERC